MVPVSFNKVLAHWVFAQRANQKTGRLSAERRERLDAISFVWDPEQYLWTEKYTKMKQHLYANKRIKPLVKEEELYRWYKQQKKDVRAGRISNERIRQLKSIGLDFF